MAGKPREPCAQHGKKSRGNVKREVTMRWSFALYLILIFGGLAYMAAIGFARG